MKQTICVISKKIKINKGNISVYERKTEGDGTELVSREKRVGSHLDHRRGGWGAGYTQLNESLP